MGFWDRLARHEGGQTAAEYLGLLAVVAVLSAGLVSAAPGVGAMIANGVRTALCLLAAAVECGQGPGAGAPSASEPVGTAGETEAPAAAPDEAPEDGAARDRAAAEDGLLGAFVDGFVKGDFNRQGYDSGWLEGARGVGQVLSGVLVFGDVRDAGAAIGRLVETGGRDGWLDLGLSIVGVVPLAGDFAKGFKVGKRTADVIGAAGDAGRAADAARAADDAARAGDDLAPATTPGRRGSDCAANSFTGETPVLMADGGRLPIAALIPGDMVAAFDSISRKRVARPVTATITGSGVKRLVGITVEGHAVTATDGHPFYSPRTGGWVDAGNLRPGDRLLTAGGTWATVEAVRSRRATTTVHNLAVAEHHSYYVFAGATAVLVHNAGPCEPGSGGARGSVPTVPSAASTRTATGDIDPEALDQLMNALPRVQLDGPALDRLLHPLPGVPLQDDAVRGLAANAVGTNPQGITVTPVGGAGARGKSGAPVSLITNDAGEVLGVVKVFPQAGEFAQELSALERLGELGLRHAPGVEAVGVARVDTPHGPAGIAVMTPARGTPVDQLIVDAGRSRGARRQAQLDLAEEGVADTARALAELHTVPPGSGGAVSPAFVERHVAKVQEFSAALGPYEDELTELGIRLPQLRRRVDELVMAFRRRPGGSAIAHGDAHPGNFFYDGANGVTLIDTPTLHHSLDAAGGPIGSPARDVANFTEQLAHQGYEFGLQPGEVTALQETFRRAYADAGGASISPETDAFFAARLNLRKLSQELDKAAATGFSPGSPEYQLLEERARLTREALGLEASHG